MNIILIWLINALTLIVISRILPGFHFASFYNALITALVLGLVNAVIRPIVIILTLPINILTLGIFTLVINALMLWIVQSVVKGFTIDTFSTAIWAALILWIISWISNALIHKSEKL